MRPLLVVGSSGYLGRRIAAATGLETIPVRREDIDSIDAIAASTSAFAVINAAGRLNGSDEELAEANTTVVERLLGALHDSRVRLVTLGSAAEYGRAAAAGPVAESTIEQPISSYGQTKLAATQAVRAAARAGQEAVVARVFNVVGTGMPREMPLGEFARTIAGLPQTGGEVVVRNAGTTRDFVAASFVVRAAIALASRPFVEPVVNVCGGLGVSYGRVVEEMLALAGKTGAVRDLGLPVDPLSVVGEPTLLAQYGLAEVLGASEVVREVFGIRSSSAGAPSVHS